MKARFFEPSLLQRLVCAAVGGIIGIEILLNGWRVQTVLDRWIGYPALLPAGIVIALLVFVPSIPARRATRVRVALIGLAGGVLFLVMSEVYDAFGGMIVSWDSAILTAGYLLSMGATLAAVAGVRFNWRLLPAAAAASALTHAVVNYGPQVCVFERCSDIRLHLSAILTFVVWTMSMAVALHWSRSPSAAQRD